MTPWAMHALATARGERGIRLARRRVDELGGDHRAVAAHVADARVGRLQRGQALREDARRSRCARSISPSFSKASIAASAAAHAIGLPP